MDDEDLKMKLWQILVLVALGLGGSFGLLAFILSVLGIWDFTFDCSGTERWC
jgi:hypothetical protein